LASAGPKAGDALIASRWRVGLLGASIVASLALATCGGGDGGGNTSPASIAVSSPSCGELEYEAPGEPQAVIVSDLPMQGDSAERSAQQVDAIKLVLEQQGWQAGGVSVGFQACDDSIAKTGLWDVATCRSNARAYASNEKVLGVIGTYNSGCAAEEIPILNRASVAMISPGNTAVCLTEESPICTDYSPKTRYPTGERNYARVVPNDAFQGAGLAEFARKQGIERPFVLYAAGDPTSTGQAVNFRGAAATLGLKLAGYESWDPEARDYRRLMDEVKRSGADAVVLAGLIEQNGAQVIRDKVAVVGANASVPLLAFDGFSQQSTIDKAGAASRGMFASIPGKSLDELSSVGQDFVSDLEIQLRGKPVELYAPYGGEAAAVLLDAVENAGGVRSHVPAAMLDVRRNDGILGTYGFDAGGDPTVGPVTIFRAAGSFEAYDEVAPASAVVDGARLGH
jgi:branched-chain amino acid transport system substrate-binding protein